MKINSPNSSQSIENIISQEKDDLPQKEVPPSHSPEILKKDFLEKLNKILFSYQRALKIEIDKDLNLPVYKIIDLETNEIIKQIPLEEILKLKKAILEFLNNEFKNPEILKGVFLEKEA